MIKNVVAKVLPVPPDKIHSLTISQIIDQYWEIGEIIDSYPRSWVLFSSAIDFLMDRMEIENGSPTYCLYSNGLMYIIFKTDSGVIACSFEDKEIF